MSQPASLSLARARELVDSGHATALLPDRWPAPIRYDGCWWHQLTTSPDDADLIVAPAELAAVYEGLLTSLEASERALRGLRP